MSHKDYIGDSVYAELDGGMIKLTTANGFGATNTIYLEPSVYAELVAYARRVWKMDQTEVQS